MTINNTEHKLNNNIHHNHNRWAFLQEFLKHPLQIGSIIPSSRFLERAILQSARVDSARTIVELGCGTGGTTRAILNHLRPDAKLLSIEVNPRFYAMISEIDDERLIPHLGSAEQLGDILDMYGLDDPDVVISGIPFSTMKNGVGSRIIRDIDRLLPPNSRFVAYQFSGRVAELCRPYMGTERSILEIRNIPPMRVYEWEKRGQHKPSAEAI
ncbi:MAG: methyltransferase type 12 [Gammaproteobacteria bacterium]|jgi:phospholipid N-methyltransferase